MLNQQQVRDLRSIFSPFWCLMEMLAEALYLHDFLYCTAATWLADWEIVFEIELKTSQFLHFSIVWEQPNNVNIKLCLQNRASVFTFHLSPICIFMSLISYRIPNAAAEFACGRI